jgi:hypothetical protein
MPWQDFPDLHASRDYFHKVATISLASRPEDKYFSHLPRSLANGYVNVQFYGHENHLFQK